MDASLSGPRVLLCAAICVLVVTWGSGAEGSSTGGEVYFTMSVQPAGCGETIPAAGRSYEEKEGVTVAISAVESSGCVFHHWEVTAGVSVADSFSPNTTVLMDQDKTIIACFVEYAPDDREFRGFWASAFNPGFKDSTEVDRLVANAVAGSYNAIIPEILAYHDTGTVGHGAYWNSSIIPKATDVDSEFDPLGYLVQEAHANGIEVHPWIIPFRVSSDWPPYGNSLLQSHPEWLMVPQAQLGGGPAQVDGRYMLDPGSTDVQNYLMNIVNELCNTYEIDGVHWDYLRYMQRDSGYPADTSYTQSTLARFLAITGETEVPAPYDVQWSDFRRHTIDEVVRRAIVEVQLAVNPRQPLRYTAALLTSGYPPSSFESSYAYERFQNWRLWMEKGYLDAGIPMCYYDEEYYGDDYRLWVNAANNWKYNRHMFIGTSLYRNSFAENIQQLEYALSAGSDGIATFSYYNTNDMGEVWSNWYSHLGADLFLSPVPTPSMPWREAGTSSTGTVCGRVVDAYSGTLLDHAVVTIEGGQQCLTDGNGFYILTQLPGTAGGVSYNVAASYGDYVDRTASVSVLAAGVTIQDIELGGCLVDSDCQDGLFCNGEEYCDENHLCRNGTPPCTAGTWCEESADVCVQYGDGDFDVDGDVDLFDFGVFQNCFGQQGLGECQPGVLEGEDGIVDMEDYSVFEQLLSGPEYHQARDGRDVRKPGSRQLSVPDIREGGFLRPH